MSSIVKTITPFINKSILCEALDAIGCAYLIQGNEIVLSDRVDYRGNQTFIFENGKYALRHDSDGIIGRGFSFRNYDPKQYAPVSEFLKQIENAYNQISDRRIREAEEAERRRLEEERKVFVGKQKQTVIANAQKKGYSVREENAKDKIKLVLVRTTY